MRDFIYWSPRFRADKPPISDGIGAGCPFCIAKRDRQPSIGQRILFLTSGDAGQFGTCVEDKHNSIRFDQFLVKMDYEVEKGGTRVVTLAYDLFSIEPLPSAPVWMPSLSIADALAVHEYMLQGIDNHLQLNDPADLSNLCYPIVSGCWSRRFPLTAEEILAMLQAHYCPVDKQFCQLYTFGIELLVRTHGKPAIKRKRMKPLSQGKYLSSNQRKMWFQLFGHD
jgi:hypothetical protein